MDVRKKRKEKWTDEQTERARDIDGRTGGEEAVIYERTQRAMGRRIETWIEGTRPEDTDRRSRETRKRAEGQRGR